mgnify:CR=1 FL=1
MNSKELRGRLEATSDAFNNFVADGVDSGTVVALDDDGKTSSISNFLFSDVENIVARWLIYCR